MLHCRSVSHQNTPLVIREKLDMTEKSQADWLMSLAHIDAIILSTCNRLELYAVAQSSAEMDLLWENLLHYKAIAAETIAPYVSRLSNYDAAHHLFQVASSLRSMALGEAQILGQVTKAFEQSQSCNTCGHRMSMLFRSAIHAAKRIQTETRIGYGNISVSSLGINKLEEMLGPLHNYTFLVVGAGEMGQAVIKGLVHRQISDIRLVSRTFETARQVAETWQIQAYPLTDLKELLTTVDIVFTTSSAPYPILSFADIHPVMHARKGRDLYFVDIAVPRDVAPDVVGIEGVHLFDLDTLQEVIDSNYHEREQALPQAHSIIDEELSHFWKDYQSLAVVPTIQLIRKQVNQFREQELERIYHKLNGRGCEEIEQLFEEFSRRFMNKVLHQPTIQLRSRAGEQHDPHFASIARDLFGIDDNQ